MRRIWRLGLVVSVLISCAGCDQATKNIARQSLVSSSPVSLLNDSVRFEYTENSGAFLGLGSNLPREGRFLLLVILTSASLLLSLALTVSTRNLNVGQWIGLSLLVGGGLGNLIDRVFNDGAVIDFVRLGVGSLQTGVFNLADVAIVVGIILLLLGSAKGRRETTSAAQNSLQPPA
jgi:signal peptidase II